MADTTGNNAKPGGKGSAAAAAGGAEPPAGAAGKPAGAGMLPGRDEKIPAAGAGAAKQEGKKQAAAAKAPKKGVPAYLFALVIILGIVAGYAAFLALQPQGSGGGASVQPAFSDKITGVMLYSDECKLCAPYNSFEFVLSSNGINFEFRAVEVSSPEGAALVEMYWINSVPTLLIDANSLNPNWIVPTNEGALVSLQSTLEKERAGNKYLLPEMRYDPTLTIMYLEKPEEGCETPEGKVSVLYFSDPYSFTSLTSSRELKTAVETFGDALGISYLYRPGFSLEMIRHSNQAEVERLAGYYLCAEKQGKLVEMQNYALGAYCSKDGDYQTSDAELSLCAVANPHYGIPLTAAELHAAAGLAGLDEEMLEICLSGIGTDVGEGIVRAADYGITSKAVLPVAIVGCRLNVHAVNLVAAICDANPGLNGCV